jgi:transposase
MSYEAALPAARVRGRPSKFTPERVQQIQELVKSGLSCDEIAAFIGVTSGTLKVSCSRLGISLRRPRPTNGKRPAVPSSQSSFATMTKNAPPNCRSRPR